MSLDTEEDEETPLLTGAHGSSQGTDQKELTALQRAQNGLAGPVVPGNNDDDRDSNGDGDDDSNGNDHGNNTAVVLLMMMMTLTTTMAISTTTIMIKIAVLIAIVTRFRSSSINARCVWHSRQAALSSACQVAFLYCNVRSYAKTASSAGCRETSQAFKRSW